MKQFLECENFLQTVIEESRRNSENAAALAGNLSHAQMNWKPAPTQWSIAQCLEHLAITSHKFDIYFTEALARARRKRPVTSPPPYRPTLIGGWLARQVNPDGGRNFPAPKVFRPTDSSNIEGALDSYLNQQKVFAAFVEQSEAIDYNRTRLRSPVTPLMRYSMADAFVVTVMHGRRHLRQAERVRAMPGFPTA